MKKFPYWEYFIIFALGIKINGQNICKKHIERILGEVSRLRAVFENMVLYSNDFQLEISIGC